MEGSDHDKYLSRISLMMDYLAINGPTHMKVLAEEYGTSERTIRRDIDERLHFFPIEIKRGIVTLEEGFNLDDKSLRENELLITELALNSIKGIDEVVDKTLHTVRAKLSYPLFFSPYNLKAELYEPINMNSELLNKIEDAITNRNVSSIKSNDLTSSIDPYKVVAFDGIWYLFAKDRNDMKIKTYLISNIQEFRASTKVYSTTHVNTDELLENVHTAWFEDGNSFDVTVKVKKEIAHYFELKKHLSSQEIIKKNVDSSIIVKFSVSCDEDVDNLIKAWLPHIEVIKPERFRKKLISELELYVKELKNYTL
ncbi:WYL domain-containing protein [Sulfurimonas aquatica]|uniref:WYL domain-containing protein n=1 Tax=Sulfurimonas aquatica TaxID=2672570 RepID=A0A975B0Y5_9BACT|nr:WYL domain-containing protein [Sulfurimonas aquatica]QSZ42212.1 WYL domain-containing protein [Sulfurimonas aquatica]